MISLPIGLIAFVVIIIASLTGVDLANYLNWHSVIIVFGGTVAVFAIGSPNAVIASVLKNVGRLFRQRQSMTRIQGELMSLARNRSSVARSADPLIMYAIGLWERGEDANTFQALLSQYRDKLENEDAETVASLHALAKYPPALGMTGTVMGMISLFANLGSSNKAALGPSLAVAMTATFYGLITANALLNPLADRIAVEAIHRKKYYGLVYEILTLINRRDPINMIEEELKHRAAA